MLRGQNMSDTKTILVTGGSGFIGTVVCKQLVEAGHNVINIDRKKKEIEGVTQYPFDISNHQVKGILQLTKPNSIIHLAADHEVARSVTDPAVYYANNVANTIGLLNNAVEAGVTEFIYSSSSSVYGDPDVFPTPEITNCDPQSPYARTKYIVEQILEDYSKAYNFNYVSLRYFNAAGAMPDASHGYTQEPASHLVPIACRKNLEHSPLQVYGNQYNTADGTAERDYTHVCDIASAHLAALKYLKKTNVSNVFNIGAGDAKSVMQVFNQVCTVTGKNAEYQINTPRAGDVEKTLADISKAKLLLDWEPQYSFNDVIQHAVTWEKKHKRKK